MGFNYVILRLHQTSHFLWAKVLESRLCLSVKLRRMNWRIIDSSLASPLWRSNFSFHCCCGQQIASWSLVGFSLLGRISRLTILRFKTSSGNYSGNGNHLGRENIRGENGKRPWVRGSGGSATQPVATADENSFNVGTDKEETNLFVMTFKAIMEGMNPVHCAYDDPPFHDFTFNHAGLHSIWDLSSLSKVKMKPGFRFWWGCWSDVVLMNFFLLWTT